MSQLKLLEDFVTLARAGSFVRAAEQRHVTHPAFGRRIRALEAWVGTPLVDRSSLPITLTPEGQVFYNTANQVLEQLNRVRRQLQASDQAGQGSLRIATGRSLARTLVTDWVSRLQKGSHAPLSAHVPIDISTGMMADMAKMLAQGKTDFLCCYEHPALSIELLAEQVTYMTIATDKLVPTCQRRKNGTPLYELNADSGRSIPLISYSGGLAMARILGDKLHHFPYPLVSTVRCDSLDTAMGSVLKGMGVAWLPLSMIANECRRGTLVQLGGKGDEIAFEVRLYRSRAPLSDLAESVWAFTQQGR